MALVEILTQRLPVWNSADQRDPQLPGAATLPQPFLDIARNSLQRDPARRWTIGQIAARLQPNAQLHPSPVSVLLSSAPSLPAIARAASQASAQELSPRLRSRASQESRSSSPRYIIPAVAGVLILAGIIAVPRLFNQRPKSGHSSAASKGTSAQLAVPNPVKSPGKSTPRAAASPSANSLKSPANAKSAAAGNSPAPAVLRTEEKRKPVAANPERGEVLSQVLPDVSPKARDTIRGTVKIAVRVHVNPAGSVTAAEFDGAVPSKYFADLALRAARDWTFQSPESAGRSVPSEWLLRFYFTSSATKAVPEQTMP